MFRLPYQQSNLLKSFFLPGSRKHWAFSVWECTSYRQHRWILFSDIARHFTCCLIPDNKPFLIISHLVVSLHHRHILLSLYVFLICLQQINMFTTVLQFVMVVKSISGIICLEPSARSSSKDVRMIRE
jgi:hypothetical protein